MLEKVVDAAARKQDHIRICLQEDVDNPGQVRRPFDKVLLPVEAWPKFDFDSIQTKTKFLGREFSSPLLITGMTGGILHARDINTKLAHAACAKNIPMGLGSMKMLLSDPSIQHLFDVKSSLGTDANKLFLIGNMGLVSFNHGITVAMIQGLVERLRLDAFAIHLNALQEAIQPEGERNFSNLEKTLETLVRSLHIPVIVKEVGCGMGADTLSRIQAAGVKAVDISGAGGTSWAMVEALRSPDKRLGTLFKNWGLPTEISLSNAKKFDAFEIIASGGIRDGLQAAKAVASGATMVGIGMPLFKAALDKETPNGVLTELQFFEDGLKTAMFCSGNVDIIDLKNCLNSI